MKKLHKVWLGLTVCAALAAVATAYLDPHLMVTLANQVWACF
jgi:hypothetical protein